jgi:hypothetical protein
MRLLLVLPLLLVASPALAQFPPPGIYECDDAAGTKLGTLSLLVAGDYQWDAGGQTYVGQIASSGSSVEALSGPLAEAKWRGSFVTQMDQTMFVFDTASGQVICK